MDERARIWGLPTVLTGDPGRLRVWTEVATGLELDEAAGNVRVLDAQVLRQRVRRPDELRRPAACRRLGGVVPFFTLQGWRPVQSRC
jgi:hypothetical protein